jgi:hypothetical protein
MKRRKNNMNERFFGNDFVQKADFTGILVVDEFLFLS